MIVHISPASRSTTSTEMPSCRLLRARPTSTAASSISSTTATANRPRHLDSHCRRAEDFLIAVAAGLGVASTIKSFRDYYPWHGIAYVPITNAAHARTSLVTTTKPHANSSVASPQPNHHHRNHCRLRPAPTDTPQPHRRDRTSRREATPRDPQPRARRQPTNPPRPKGVNVREGIAQSLEQHAASRQTIAVEPASAERCQPMIETRRDHADALPPGCDDVVTLRRSWRRSP